MGSMCSSNAKKDVLVDTHSLQAKTEVVDKLDPQMKPQQLPRTTSIGLEKCMRLEVIRSVASFTATRFDARLAPRCDAQRQTKLAEQ
eukprot:4076874-Pleurochrysis_carterae.AAC.2